MLAWFFVLVLAGGALVPTPAVALEPAALTGTWTGTIETRGHTHPASLIVESVQRSGEGWLVDAVFVTANEGRDPNDRKAMRGTAQMRDGKIALQLTSQKMQSGNAPDRLDLSLGADNVFTGRSVRTGDALVLRRLETIGSSIESLESLKGTWTGTAVPPGSAGTSRTLVIESLVRRGDAWSVSGLWTMGSAAPLPATGEAKLRDGKVALELKVQIRGYVSPASIALEGTMENVLTGIAKSPELLQSVSLRRVTQSTSVAVAPPPAPVAVALPAPPPVAPPAPAPRSLAPGTVARAGERLAVIIGIGNYDAVGIPKLKFTTSDADAIYDVLTTRAGFKKEHVLLLTDTSATRPTLRAIKSALGTFLARNARPEDTVLIFFAGHGAPEIDLRGQERDGLAKYLIPVDADPNDLYATALSMEEIHTIFSRIEAERIVVFLDACYSGAAGGRTFVSQRAGTRNLTVDELFLDRLTNSKGRAIITASRSTEVSIELAELGHGVFTYYLVEGLKGAADRDGDGIVTLQELYEYVGQNVSQKSRAAGGNQHPVMKGELEGVMPLVKVAR
jgi:hypothetical protein